MDYETAMKGFILDGRKGKACGGGADPDTLSIFQPKDRVYYHIKWEDGEQGKIYKDSPEFQRMISLEQYRVTELESALQALVDEIRLADLYNMDQGVLQRVKALGIKVGK